MTGTILITGALGQDGWFLAERLVAAGHRVVGLVRPERLSDRPAPCPLAAVDLGDPAAVDALINDLRPDRIFHVAAVHHASGVPLTADAALWRAMTTVNFLATTHFIQAILARVPHCRLVYAASSQMYRPATENRAVAEDAPRDPPTWYGLTKSWSMDAIRFARERHGLHGSTAILFNHESIRRPEAFLSRTISLGAARIRRGLADTLAIRNIGAVADWCAAEDVADALVRMAAAGEPDDYAVGAGRLSCVRDLVAAAFAAVDLDWRAHVTWAEDAVRPSLYADTTRIRTRLGWEPVTPIGDVMRRMTEADLAGLGPAPGTAPGTALG